MRMLDAIEQKPLSRVQLCLTVAEAKRFRDFLDDLLSDPGASCRKATTPLWNVLCWNSSRSLPVRLFWNHDTTRGRWGLQIIANHAIHRSELVQTRNRPPGHPLELIYAFLAAVWLKPKSEGVTKSTVHFSPSPKQYRVFWVRT